MGFVEPGRRPRRLLTRKCLRRFGRSYRLLKVMRRCAGSGLANVRAWLVARRCWGAAVCDRGVGPLSSWNRYHDEDSRGEGREQSLVTKYTTTDETAEEDRGDNPRYLTC